MYIIERDILMKRFLTYNACYAKERLRTMLEDDPDQNDISSKKMKEEIYEIISKFYDINREDYDIKVVIKQKKRLKNV